MNNQAPIKIAMAEDHAIFRKSIMPYISRHIKVQWIAEAENGKVLLDKIAAAGTIPDICLLDISMPVMNGYETIKALTAHYPTVKTIVLTMHDNEHAIVNMLTNGARGYVFKDNQPEELINCINTVHTKGYYFAGMDYYFKIAMEGKGSKRYKLNEKEVEFLQLVCLDLHYDKIAEIMNLSTRTMEWHRNNLFQKLDVKSRTGLVSFSVSAGITSFAAFSKWAHVSA